MRATAVLITGGGGFLGSHLAEYFLEQKIPVICVDNFSTGTRDNRAFLEKKGGKLLTFIEADVAKPWAWVGDIADDVHRKISHVFHFASPASPPLYQQLSIETMWVNSVGLYEAMQFADSANARVIFASTSEVYGDPNISPQPESYWGSVNSFGERSCYDESKRFGEGLIFSHNKRHHTKHGLVRIFNTYGPRMNPQDGRVVINFLVQALKGEALTVYGDGSQTRSFCYVSDLVDGIVRYAESELSEPVNIGNDKEFTILELAKEVQALTAKNTGKTLPLQFFDLPKDDPKQRRPDLTKARRLLAPWQPQVPLREGLIKMLEWLKA
jgi:nucleoside-diphosphate-sugar epimerase